MAQQRAPSRALPHTGLPACTGAGLTTPSVSTKKSPATSKFQATAPQLSPLQVVPPLLPPPLPCRCSGACRAEACCWLLSSGSGDSAKSTCSQGQGASQQLQRSEVADTHTHHCAAQPSVSAGLVTGTTACQQAIFAELWPGQHGSPHPTAPTQQRCGAPQPSGLL